MPKWVTDTAGAVVVASLLSLVALVKPSFQPAPVVQPVQPVTINLIGASAPVVVATIYSSDSCGPCRSFIKAIKTELPRDQWIIRDVSDKDVAAAHIVIDKRITQVGPNRIESWPTTVFRVNGREVTRHEGVMTPDELANKINTLAKQQR